MHSQEARLVEAETGVGCPRALNPPGDGGHDERAEPDKGETPHVPPFDERRPPRQGRNQNQVRAHSKTERIEVLCGR